MVDALLKIKDVSRLTGRCKTYIYRDIGEGTFTPPVKPGGTGSQMSVWPESEVAALNRATVADRSPAEKRALVRQLVEARKSGASVAA